MTNSWKGITARINFFLAVSALFLLAAGCNSRSGIGGYAYSQGQAKLAGRTIGLEVARDSAKKEQGLSGQAAISEEQGMLFVYDQVSPVRPYFWMKDMNFPIDIVWIRSGKVVDITQNAPALPGTPQNELPLYQPKTEVDAVLELKAGWAARYGLKEGDLVAVSF